MPDASTAAYGIEGKSYLQRFYMSDDMRIPKSHKAFHIIVTTKLYEINTIAGRLDEDV